MSSSVITMDHGEKKLFTQWPERSPHPGYVEWFHRHLSLRKQKQEPSHNTVSLIPLDWEPVDPATKFFVLDWLTDLAKVLPHQHGGHREWLILAAVPHIESPYHYLYSEANLEEIFWKKAGHFCDYFWALDAAWSVWDTFKKCIERCPLIVTVAMGLNQVIKSP